MSNPLTTKPAFEAAAKGKELARDGLPSPREVAEAGIKTRETIDWLSQEELKPPMPKRVIDDPYLRAASDKQARAEIRDQAQALREDFWKRSEKSRVDFEMARLWRAQTHERER